VNVLVTGGAGYIGSHCVLALMESGYDVIIFDNLTTGHRETIEKLSKLDLPGKFIGFYKGDLTNRYDLERTFSSYDIDAVMHFAAFSQVAESMKNPSKYYRNNVLGTLNLLDSMRIHDV